MKTIHLIEPTLADQTGHCYGYVRSLVKTNTQFDIHVWLEKRAEKLLREFSCNIHPFFRLRWRKIQQYFCLRKLLAQNQTIFIPTAGSLDLHYLDWLLTALKSKSKVFLHFHQFKIKPKKLALLRKLAQKYPEWVIMAPTPELVDLFKSQGFQQCEYVPCPGYEPSVAPLNASDEAVKLIYAGAARADKGFAECVELVDFMQKNALSMPIEMQISPPHSGRYDQSTEQALAKLHAITGYPLKIYAETLEKSAYQALFQQAICLLIYDPQHYHDKFSGVALDAFYAGCPVIATAGTWAGKMVTRFQAGIVISDRTPAIILAAINSILENYPTFQTCATRAGKQLEQEHNPANTLAVFEKYLTDE